MTTAIVWRGLTLSRDTGYRITGLTGWEDLPDVDVEDAPRPFRDGNIAGPLYARGRTVTAEGMIFDPDNAANLVIALQRSASKSPDLEPLTITLYGRTLTAYGRIVRRSLPQTLKYAVGRQAWALQWSCPDPLRFGPVVGTPGTRLPGAAAGVVLPTRLPTALGTAGGTIDLPNDGDAAYRPTLRVTGPTAGGFLLTEARTGRQLRYSADVPAKETVTIDLDRRRVTLSGGTSVRRSLDVAQWFEVPPANPAGGTPGGTSVAFAQLTAGASADTRALLSAVNVPAGAHL